MKRIVFDSYSILSLFEKETGHDEIMQLLADIANGEKEGCMSVINVGEVFYIIERKRGEKKAQAALQAILQLGLELIDVDLNHSLEAASLKAKHKLSYADAFAASLTIRKKAVLVTGDKDFIALEGVTNFKVKFI